MASNRIQYILYLIKVGLYGVMIKKFKRGDYGKV